MASLDESSRHILTDPAKLIHAADKAVYAAKHAGRNCVRVFAIRARYRVRSRSRRRSRPGARSRARSPGLGDQRETAPQADGTAPSFLIEDDPLVVALVRSALGDRAGHRLLVAGSGEEAVRLSRWFRAAVPDLVVCDLHLPGMSGNAGDPDDPKAPRAAAPVVVISADEAPERAEEVAAGRRERVPAQEPPLRRSAAADPRPLPPLVHLAHGRLKVLGTGRDGCPAPSSRRPLEISGGTPHLASNDARSWLGCPVRGLAGALEGRCPARPAERFPNDLWRVVREPRS